MAHNYRRTRIKPAILAVAALTLGCHNHGAPEYGLPITLDSSLDRPPADWATQTGSSTSISLTMDVGDRSLFTVSQ
jgi:hypothetical protein